MQLHLKSVGMFRPDRLGPGALPSNPQGPAQTIGPSPLRPSPKIFRGLLTRGWRGGGTSSPGIEALTTVASDMPVGHGDLHLQV